MSAEAIGAEVLRVMQFLTPKKVSDLTIYEKSEEKVSLSGLFVGSDSADEKHKLEKARVLPINYEDSEEDNGSSQKFANKNSSEESLENSKLENTKSDDAPPNEKHVKGMYDSFYGESKSSIQSLARNHGDNIPNYEIDTRIEEEIERIRADLEKRDADRAAGVGKDTIRSAREEKELLDRLTHLERLKQPSASVFLIEERAKSKANQQNLKRGEIYKLYQSVINTHIQTDETVPLENKGVLVNKKQE